MYCFFPLSLRNPLCKAFALKQTSRNSPNSSINFSHYLIYVKTWAIILPLAFLTRKSRTIKKGRNTSVLRSTPFCDHWSTKTVHTFSHSSWSFAAAGDALSSRGEVPRLESPRPTLTNRQSWFNWFDPDPYNRAPTGSLRRRLFPSPLGSLRPLVGWARLAPFGWEL